MEASYRSRFGGGVGCSLTISLVLLSAYFYPQRPKGWDTSSSRAKNAKAEALSRMDEKLTEKSTGTLFTVDFPAFCPAWMPFYRVANWLVSFWLLRWVSRPGKSSQPLRAKATDFQHNLLHATGLNEPCPVTTWQSDDLSANRYPVWSAGQGSN